MGETGPVPEFPEKIIGRITTTGWFLPQPHIEGMIGSIMSGDPAGFMEAYMNQLGKVTSAVTHIVELGAPGFDIADDMLILTGMTATTLPGESHVIPVTGKTGIFANIGGEAEIEIDAILNGSGAQTFSITVFPKRKSWRWR